MFLELIATVFAGIGAAGLVMALNWTTGRRLPRWLMPVGAGAAMIAMTLWSEYNWYDRTVAGLPEGIEVAEVSEARQIYRPWTYALPYVDRFLAVDVGGMQSNPARPGEHIANIYLMGRWQPVKSFPVAVDCGGLRRAALMDEARFGEDGAVEGAAWTQVSAGDPVLSAACAQG
ncbi:hypothetical protein [Mangrovicoccus algicola]|uniref:Uncharacterized protein n=1 Tax=Mangrovicoccus algicola TaxID=2771008 RepID=A0A8J6YST2_9RHOB|nr:hypothetical protein [Mangrovicoccus algicola]MBE3637127.1 hypothetical protein [Mangrovicoccus algicola]